MKSLLAPCLLAFLSLLPSCQTLAVGGGAVPEMGPVIPGIASYVVCDTHDKKVVLSHNADQRRPIASLTKIAMGVVVLDTIAATHGSMDERLTIPSTVQMLGTSALGLQPGDQMSIRDAMHCALIGSDNFAAEALAQHLGPKILQMTGQSGAPLGAFVAQMNALASTLGMSNTHFANPHGLDLGPSSGSSTAADLARLTLHAINKGDFNFFVSQQQRKVSYTSGGAAKTFVVKNTNELLGKSRIDGVKTGTTNAAGPCLIITAPRPATVVKQADGSTLVIPHRLIVVELAANDRFNQGQQLLNQGWANYDAWQNSGRHVASAGELLSPPTP